MSVSSSGVRAVARLSCPQALGDLLHDDWADIWDSPRCAAIRAESVKMEHLCQLKGKEAAE